MNAPKHPNCGQYQFPLKKYCLKKQPRQNSSGEENIVSLTALSNPERKEAIQYLNHVRWTQQPYEQALTDQRGDNLKYQKE